MNKTQKTTFYRLCRLWHGYLSAFAFVTLIFFSATGLLLNHPEWFSGGEPDLQQHSIILPTEKLDAAKASEDTPRAVAEALLVHIPLSGEYTQGEIQEDSALLRFEGVTGNTDATIDMNSGQGDITIEKAKAISVLGELHRGVKSGTAWRLLIDVAAILILALSLVGFIIFFSIKRRLGTALALTGASLALLLGIFVIAVP